MIKNIAYLIAAIVAALFMPIVFTLLLWGMKGDSYVSVSSLVIMAILASVLSYCLVYNPLNRMTIARSKVLKVICAILTLLWSCFCFLFLSLLENA